MPVILIILAVLVVIGVGFIVTLYNRLIKGRNRVAQSDSDIDVQLKRRYDLIPNLLESVKGYMKHERETLDSVVKARGQAMGAQSDSSEGRQAENILEGALKSLFALAENYPDLKASQNFLSLQSDLADTEDKIQAARRLYNGTLRSYIDLLQTFPSNMIAGMFGFKPTGEYFALGGAEEAEPVKVSF